MLLFPAYCILVWYFCVRFRRQVWGFLALACGVTFIVTLATLQRRLREIIQLSDSSFSNLDFLLWVESGAVLVVGLFLVCLPAHRCQIPCRGCGYELEGLEHNNPRCPECGLESAARKPRRLACGVCGRKSLMDPERPRCGACEGEHHHEVTKSTKVGGNERVSG